MFVLKLTPLKGVEVFWKLNTSLLQKKQYVEMMNQEIETTLTLTVDKDPIQRWETLKKRIKRATCKYARECVDENKLVISQLTEVVNEYESRLPLTKEEDDLT